MNTDLKTIKKGKARTVTITFENWLTAQQDRQDHIGDLARTPGMQSSTSTTSRRKADEHRNWAETVIKSDQPGHIATFNEAWQEFLIAKEATK